MRITVYGYQDKFSGIITKYNLQLIKSFDGGCALKREVEIPDYLKLYTCNFTAKYRYDDKRKWIPCS